VDKKEKFFGLLEPVYDRLERFALNMTRSRDAAKDVVGETIIAAFDAFGSLKNEKAMLSFLFTICSRKYYDRLRQNGRHPESAPEQIDRLYSTEASPDEIADIALLHDAIDRLPPNLKEILLLYEIAGLKYREIAIIKDISINNVKITIHRARGSLAEMLGEKTPQKISREKK
jgi:RNA polymerase sigma-70 factor (ECF subfamily)